MIILHQLQRNVGIIKLVGFRLWLLAFQPMYCSYLRNECHNVSFRQQGHAVRTLDMLIQQFPHDAGSRDTMVIIWDIAQQKGKGKAGVQPSLPLLDQPRQILYGHRDAIVCLAVCTQLDLVVSAAADGNLLFHTLSNGR